MASVKNFFATRWGIISVGAIIGIFAPPFAEVGKSGKHGHLRGLFR